MILSGYRKLQDDLHSLYLKIKQHEENIELLKVQAKQMDDSIFELQVNLGKCHLSCSALATHEDDACKQDEDETIKSIMRHDKSAAGIIFQLRNHNETQIPPPPLTNDVLGIVATLGRVKDENLGRLLSEYLGIETMLAVVCKTYDGIRSLEKYDKEGSIIKDSGIHGLGTSIGRSLGGRFCVFCLENLRPYVGEFLANDSQRRLDLCVPRLSNGEIPPGFLGFAVNMIDIDNVNLRCLTANSDGLRETLFYNLFLHLQIYKSRSEMMLALSCIRDGAISLDGGIINSTGIFSLGSRDEINVKFPKTFDTLYLPEDYSQTESLIEEMRWKKNKMQEDIIREQLMLDDARSAIELKRKERHNSMAKSIPFAIIRGKEREES